MFPVLLCFSPGDPPLLVILRVECQIMFLTAPARTQALSQQHNWKDGELENSANNEKSQLK